VEILKLDIGINTLNFDVFGNECNKFCLIWCWLFTAKVAKETQGAQGIKWTEKPLIEKIPNES